MNQTIDISKKTSTELKAMIYDRIVTINNIQKEQEILNNQLLKTLELEANTPTTGEKPKQSK